MIRPSGVSPRPRPIASEYEDEKPTMRDRGTSGIAPVVIASPSSGIISRLPSCFPARQIERETPHSLRPEQKFSVPSIGSSTATQPSPTAPPAVQLSSPMKHRSGSSPRSQSRMASSRKMSAAVTGLSSGFQVMS